ncbi:MAG: MaoC/PaaZ C-terminal domain-containing protein [Planctomycetota bacterium]
MSLFAESSPSTSEPTESQANTHETPTVDVQDADLVLYSEDLAVGDCWTSQAREISGEDVATFASLTGDHDPLHSENPAASPYGKPIVHGLLGLSVLAGLGTNYPRAATLTFMGIEDWQFLAPVFFGDSVQVRNEIVSLEQHGRRAVKVRWLRQLINDSGRVVQEGHFLTLVANRARVRKRPR